MYQEIKDAIIKAIHNEENSLAQYRRLNEISTGRGYQREIDNIYGCIAGLREALKIVEDI